jgi:hypothetical protein
LNSKGCGQEKRARRVATRPEPTINGNCDSWNFIVGKNPRPSIDATDGKGKLQGSNMKVIHSL